MIAQHFTGFIKHFFLKSCSSTAAQFKACPPLSSNPQQSDIQDPITRGPSSSGNMALHSEYAYQHGPREYETDKLVAS